MAHGRDIVLITGVSGGIGSRVAAALAADYRVVGFDLEVEERAGRWAVDLGSERSVARGFAAIREEYGRNIASVVHLAAYFDFSGDESPLYQRVNVEGTRRLLADLQTFRVEQFLYASTMLVHRPGEPGVPIREDSPLAPAWAYPQSKLQTERTVEREHGDIPYTILRLAGVYDDDCKVPLLAHQMKRIYERRMQGHLFAGDRSRGQAFVHRDDAIEAICTAVRERSRLRDTPVLLIGERDVMSYEELQNRLGRLMHGENWSTLGMPKPLARVGAWLQQKAEKVIPDAIDQGEEPFIKPFMIALADDHYELDTTLAGKKLHWRPRHSLRERLPVLVSRLRENPERWYRKNGLRIPEWLAADEVADAEADALRVRYEEVRRREHRQNLWAPFATIALGFWLATSPPILGYQASAMAWSDLLAGVAVVATGSLSLSWHMAWARLITGAIGIWLLFAPLIFWAPAAAGYLNDTVVGALLIGFAMLVRPPVGVSPIARLTGPDVPAGWDYSPSTWTQRLPVILLALLGLFISRYLTAYQLGHIESAWDPLFGAGTARVIASDVSRAWPVPDAGVGGVTYMLEILTGVIGSSRRWRTMPWLVTLFGFLIVPLGTVSIFFIIIQPIVIGTWCSLCLLAAAAMVVQIPYSLDELVATGQFLAQRKRQDRPLWPIFLHGDTASGGRPLPPEDFEQSAASIHREMWGGGVSVPWTLLASTAIGVLLMCTRLVFGTEAPLAYGDHLIGALVITASVTAMAEVGRSVRYLNVLLGTALLALPWMLSGGSLAAGLASIAMGLALILLALPRGGIGNSYGTWNRFIR